MTENMFEMQETIKDEGGRKELSQEVARFLNDVKSLIITNRNYVSVDYNLVSTYINGVFRSTPIGQFNFYNSQTFRRDDRKDNTSRYIERWDTTASTVSQNTSSRFRQALLPDGLDSFGVEIEGLDNPEVNDFFTNVLRESWDYDALHQIDLAVADYMNYGTAIMTCYGRYMDINTSGFFELQDETGNYARAFLFNEYSFNNNYAIGSMQEGLQDKNSHSVFRKQYLTEEPILVIENNFLKSFLRIKKMKNEDSQYVAVSGAFHRLPGQETYKNEGWVEYDRYYLYEHIYVARMGTLRRGYGAGCGVNALGSVIDANYVLGTRYLNLERINDPSWIKVYGVETTRGDGGAPGIDTSPGGLTVVKPPMGAPAPIEQMIQRDTQAQVELSMFVPLREEFLKELDAAYNAFLFRPYEPVPGSATATGALIQLEDTINAYRAKADPFLNCILVPMAEQKLKHRIACMETEINQSKKATHPQLQEYLESFKQLGFVLKDSIKIKIKDFAYVRRRQAKAMEIQEQLNLVGMAAQFGEMDPDLAKSMIKKISGLYK